MAELDLSRFVIVLCRAEEPGNVGSVCRAMKTMGITRLALAGCPEYEESRLRMMAVHAADVFESAQRFGDLASALGACAMSGGFTRRRGERRKSFSLSAADFASRVFEGAASRSSGTVAMVFGNERTGLTEEELALCSLAVHIPSSDGFPSLNLAQAVQIACYELRKNAIGEIDGSAEPVTREAADAAVARVAEDLRSLGFFRQTGGSRLVDFLRDTVERSAYTPSELRYYENLFHKMASLARRGGPAP